MELRPRQYAALIHQRPASRRDFLLFRVPAHLVSQVESHLSVADQRAQFSLVARDRHFSTHIDSVIAAASALKRSPRSVCGCSRCQRMWPEMTREAGTGSSDPRTLPRKPGVTPHLSTGESPL